MREHRDLYLLQHIVFGENAISRLGEMCLDYKARSVLLLTTLVMTTRSNKDED